MESHSEGVRSLGAGELVSDFDADFLKAPGTKMPNEGTERQRTRLNVFIYLLDHSKRGLP